MDTAAGDIRVVEVTSSREGDSVVLPSLLAQIPADQIIGSVTADGAYDARQCRTAVIEQGGTAIIPSARMAVPQKKTSPPPWAESGTLRATRHFAEVFGSDGPVITPEVGPGRKPLLKSFGDRLMTRDPDRQTAEIDVHVALMNRFPALGRQRSCASPESQEKVQRPVEARVVQQPPLDNSP